MELQPETLLRGGTYRIIRTLGRGGFGFTYLAEHTQHRHNVCIKEFFSHSYCIRSSSTQAMEIQNNLEVEMTINQCKRYFHRYATCLQSFDNPSIVRVFDVFEEKNTVYYVMEYIEGDTLLQMVKRCGKISDNEARGYIEDIASALRVMHQTALHLDLGPYNIMIRATDNRAVLINFGMPNYIDEISFAHVPISNIGGPYCAVECGGQDRMMLKPSTDIYSLGATLYFMVRGEHPPVAMNIVIDGLPSLPTSLNPSVGQAIESAMQIRPANRPQSVDEFMAILNADDLIH